MKLLVVSILIHSFAINSTYAQKIGAGQDASEFFDSIDQRIEASETSGNYAEAENYVNEALLRASKDQNTSRVANYNLKLAKYAYLRGDTDQSLIHFRIYAQAAKSELSEEKNTEIYLLEEAYLDQIDQMQAEWDLDRKLLDSLRDENIAYYDAQKRIDLALKIALGAALIFVVVFFYNRYQNKQDKNEDLSQDKKEINRLSEKIAKLNEELARTTEQNNNLKSAQSKHYTYARNIQASLLPDTPHLEKFLQGSFVYHLPKNTISGDFYSLYHSEGKTVLAVFDCPGHGIDAAHSTVLTDSIFQEIGKGGITAPSMILTMMDQKLNQENQKLENDPEMISGIKIAICSIDKKTKEVEYAGCQFPLIYSHLDEVSIEKGNRHPIGDPLFSDKFYSSSNHRLSTGDCIYLATDGFYNQLGGKKNKKFMRESLLNLLQSMQGQDLAEQRFILEKVFQEWKGGKEQIDDILVVGYRL